MNRLTFAAGLFAWGLGVWLGPSSLRHHPDGTVTIAGEEVDDPDEYKGEPIPGGPTDESANDDLTAKKIKEDQKDGDSDDEGSKGESSDGGG